jgi:hypothetical protein
VREIHVGYTAKRYHLITLINHSDCDKKKGKAVPLHAMEALGGRGGIAPTH